MQSVTVNNHGALGSLPAGFEFAGYSEPSPPPLTANMVFTFDFNQKFACSLVPSSVKDCVMDFVISFLKV